MTELGTTSCDPLNLKMSSPIPMSLCSVRTWIKEEKLNVPIYLYKKAINKLKVSVMLISKTVLPIALTADFVKVPALGDTESIW